MQARIVHGRGGLRGDRRNQRFKLGAPDFRLVVAEEEPAEHVARKRDHRHGKIADDRQVSRRHAVMRRIVPVTRILADIVGAHDFRAAKCRLEDRCVARHAEFLESFARRTAERVEEVGFSALVQHIVVERAEFRAAQPGGDVGDGLDNLLEIETAAERLRAAIEGFEPAALLQLQCFGAFALGDVARDFRSADDRSARIADGRNGERQIDERPVLALAGTVS